jgi:hypothetical protein
MKNWKDTYNCVGSFYEGRARVTLNWKYGFVDTEGNEVVPVKYDWVGNFSKGRSKVLLNGKWGFVDTEGNEFVPLKYYRISDFFMGRAWVGLIIKGKRIEGEVDLDGKEYFSQENLVKIRKHRLPNIIDSIS